LTDEVSSLFPVGSWPLGLQLRPLAASMVPAMHRNKPFCWFTIGFMAGCAIGAILTIWFPWTFIYVCLGIEGLLFIGYVNYRLRHRRHPENPIYWLRASTFPVRRLAVAISWGRVNLSNTSG